MSRVKKQKISNVPRGFGRGGAMLNFMQYQIDQSGKIEDTHRLTIVVFANGKVKSLKISAVEKQKLVKAMRAFDYPKKIFIFKIFACLIFFLIKDEKIDSVMIDKEYPGHEPVIKDVLLRVFKLANSKIPDISFGEIKKKSPAHKVALEVFRGKRDADIIVGAKQVIRVLYKNK